MIHSILHILVESFVFCLVLLFQVLIIHQMQSWQVLSLRKQSHYSRDGVFAVHNFLVSWRLICQLLLLMSVLWDTIQKVLSCTKKFKNISPFFLYHCPMFRFSIHSEFIFLQGRRGRLSFTLLNVIIYFDQNQNILDTVKVVLKGCLQHCVLMYKDWK